MKLHHACFLVVSLLAPFGFAEELSTYTGIQISEPLSQYRVTVPSCIRVATAAGIGTFLQTPSPQQPFVDIEVSEWWTPAMSTNVVRIHELEAYYPSNWIFPTNAPVVFFAVTQRQQSAEHPAYANPGAYPPEYCYSITNATEAAKLMFADIDRSWFRADRDNGLVHAFATNLWNCMRTSPNPTNYYEVLRDTERTITQQQSWRVHLDAYRGLFWIMNDAGENGLVAMLNDPLLSPAMKRFVRSILYDKFGWRYVNGVLTPPQ